MAISAQGCSGNTTYRVPDAAQDTQESLNTDSNQTQDDALRTQVGMMLNAAREKSGNDPSLTLAFLQEQIKPSHDPDGIFDFKRESQPRERALWPAETAKRALELIDEFLRGGYGPEVWNGTPVKPNGHPEQGYPECVAIGSAESWCCSGVLIAPNAVITADHCVRKSCLGFTSISGPGGDARVLFGSNTNDATSTKKIVKVKRYYRYANALPYPGRNDLALLILDEDVDVQPAVIASQPSYTNEAESVVVVGFGIFDATGRSGEKRYGRVAMATPDCKGVGESSLYKCTPIYEFVAASLPGIPLENRIDGCDGDSGGPVYNQDSEEHYEDRVLIGITSRGVAGSVPGKCGLGGVYTRIDREPYIKWLLDIDEIHWAAPPNLP